MGRGVLRRFGHMSCGGCGGGGWCRRGGGEDWVGDVGGSDRGGEAVLVMELESKGKNKCGEFTFGSLGKKVKASGILPN